MALTLPADAGEPMPVVLLASAAIKRHEFPAITRQVSLRNTGTNTLWLSLDEGESWFDVACGTSWDDRVSLRTMMYCTQLGRTRFVMIGLSLMDIGADESADKPPVRTPAKSRPARRRRWLPSRAGRDRR
jgi:hypothetical protein